MAATEEFKFHKEDEEGEKIVKEKKIPKMTDKELAEEIADVVSRKSEYKQIVAWWNPIEGKEKRPGWNCTFRTYIVPLKDTTDITAINSKVTPACFSYKYRDKGGWVMKVEKAIDVVRIPGIEVEKGGEMIEKIKRMILEILEAKGKMKPGFENWGK